MTRKYKFEHITTRSPTEQSDDNSSDLYQKRLDTLTELSALDQENGFYSHNTDNAEQDSKPTEQDLTSPLFCKN